MKVLTCAIFLILALSAFAQRPSTDILATGEYPATNNDTPDGARELARVDAKRKVLQQSATYLRSLPEVKALQLSDDQINAYAIATIEEQEQPARTSTAGNRTVYQVELLAKWDADAIRRFRDLRKDKEISAVLLDLSKQIQELNQQLGDSKRTIEQRQETLDKLRLKQLTIRLYAALAKTEEGPASRRESTPAARDRAKKLGEDAIAASPNSPDAHFAMGDVFAEIESYEAAEAEYRKALAGSAESSSGHTKLANAFRLQGKFPEAIAEFREALRLDPKSALAHSDLALTYSTQRNTNDAIAEFRLAIQLDRDSVDSHNGLAVALAGQRRLPEAVVEFREVIRIDPDLAVGHYNLSIVLADMEEDAESAAELREVIRINPNHYNAHYNLGELLRLEGKYDDSARQFREYTRLAPVTPQTQRNRQRALDFIRQFEGPQGEVPK